VETPIGILPAPGGIDVTGLDVSDDDMATLLAVDVEGWRKELPLIEEFYAGFGDRVPEALREQVAKLDDRLSAS
jgi:phosphoenolpyruvate carboxykinase (GTP)